MSLETNCPDREKIFRCLHHMLEAAEEEAVRRHLGECVECRRVEQSCQQLDTLLGEWKGIEPSASFDARLRQAIENRPPPSLLATLFTRPVARAFAAAVVLIAMVAGTFMLHHFRTETAPGSVPGKAAAAAPAPSPQENTQATLTADEELKMYENLPVLENYDLLANFDVLSELSPEKKN
jgi:hypothetical protein